MASTDLKSLLQENLRVDEARRVSAVVVNERRATAVLDVTGLTDKGREAFEAKVESILSNEAGVDQVRIAATAQKTARPIIAIGSGKGGVGKSTLTANLAVALARQGMRVGLVDADIYGPSQPLIFGTQGNKPETRDEQLVPIETRFGVRLLSMGHLVAPGKALAWRGPMAGGALTQLMDAAWGDTEVLLVDLPPGTGDVQLTMLQKFKPAGAVLVSTPQDLALIDAARAGQLFDAGGVPIIGLVENMAGYACPHCGEVSDPFGAGGVEAAAGRLELPFLGRIPLHLAIRQGGDSGEPPAASDDAVAAPFAAIADILREWLTARG